MRGTGDPGSSCTSKDTSEISTTLRPMRRFLLVALAAALFAPATAGAAGARTAIFFYPWYGSPARDGSYQHWGQDGHAPPFDIASSFYPARGLYSSSDPSVLRAQMGEIATAGIDEVVVSWWGWGSPEDQRLPAVIAAARRARLTVAIHLEPYLGRTAATVETDVAHLETLGIRDFYVYHPFDIPTADWAALNARLVGVRLFAETPLVGLAAAGGFDGVYTYDIRTWSGNSFTRYCNQAHVAGMACAPSVGPGYDARRSLGDLNVRPRREGATYDGMWRAALAAHPDLVTITSYNEWQEGTQIEGARPSAKLHGFTYASYTGAWGLPAARAQSAYLDRTAYWTAACRRALRF